ncbi:hypothetical protein FHS35_009131 [Streptomyces umbrinus]|nr:hypothetical protein [Streptomyces umbrinus]
MTGRPASATPSRGGPPTLIAPRRGRRQPCEIPQLPHSLNSRLYPCGWRCDRHSPWGLQNKPKPGTPTPPRDITPSRSTDA